MLNHILMINTVLTQNPQKSSYKVTSEYPRFVYEEAVVKVGAALAHGGSKTTKCRWFRALFEVVSPK